MKRAYLCLFALLFVSSSQAADLGLGVSLRSGETTIYLPINVSPSLMVEPYISYYSNETKLAGITGTNSQNGTGLGAGVFGKTALEGSMRVYYGARLSYLRFESKSDADYYGFQQTSNRVNNGYMISPTLGLDYAISERLSAAAEVVWSYTSMREKSTYTYYGGGSSISPQQLAALASAQSADYGNSRTIETNARILIRYFF